MCARGVRKREIGLVFWSCESWIIIGRKMRSQRKLCGSNEIYTLLQGCFGQTIFKNLMWSIRFGYFFKINFIFILYVMEHAIDSKLNACQMICESAC